MKIEYLAHAFDWISTVSTSVTGIVLLWANLSLTVFVRRGVLRCADSIMEPKISTTDSDFMI